MQETKTPGKTKMPALQVCEMERLSKLVGPMSASCLYLSPIPNQVLVDDRSGQAADLPRMREADGVFGRDAKDCRPAGCANLQVHFL
jgi:hypothetical protein